MNDDAVPTAIHRVTLLVVDHDRIGSDAVGRVIENANYPNDCVSPKAVAIETRTVDWHDGHSLNQRDGWRAAYDALFPAAPAPAAGFSPDPAGVAALRRLIFRKSKIALATADGKPLPYEETGPVAQLAIDFLNHCDGRALAVAHGDVTHEMITRATPEELAAGARHVAPPPSERARAAIANGFYHHTERTPPDAVELADLRAIAGALYAKLLQTARRLGQHESMAVLEVDLAKVHVELGKLGVV